LFIDDIYHEQKIVKDQIVPAELILSARSFRKECVGLNPPQGIWCHITGTDLVRDRDGQIYVLEDNLRCPSGVSYVLENRRIMKRTFPQVFEASRVRPVDEYPSRLLSTLQSLFPAAMESPKVAVLPKSRYSLPVSITRHITSMRSWRSKWASSWSRAAIWWRPTIAS
jgi:uncharacterized circularly permuted ATP-grasp superfamily protein